MTSCVRPRPAGHRLHFHRGAAQGGLFRSGVQEAHRRLVEGAAEPARSSISTKQAPTDSKLLIFAGERSRIRAAIISSIETAKSLNEVAATPARSSKKRTLATVKAIKYPGADGVRIPAYLTLPPQRRQELPAVVLPHGGPSARDEWGFDWLAQFLAARGYAVIQPNIAARPAIGDDWLNENGFRNWRTSIGDVTASAQ